MRLPARVFLVSRLKYVLELYSFSHVEGIYDYILPMLHADGFAQMMKTITISNRYFVYNIVARWQKSTTIKITRDFEYGAKSRKCRGCSKCIVQKSHDRLGKGFLSNCKNKTNHPISSSSYPSVTANIAIFCLKRGRGCYKTHV